jgi:hypothetical protein
MLETININNFTYKINGNRIRIYTLQDNKISEEYFKLNFIFRYWNILNRCYKTQHKEYWLRFKIHHSSIILINKRRLKSILESL